MIDQTNLKEEEGWYYEKVANVVVKNLNRRHISAEYVPDTGEALQRIVKLIPYGSTVAWGDSVTLRQVGVISKLKQGEHYKIIDAFDRDDEGWLKMSSGERLERMRKALHADVFLSGMNAVTMEGQLVSTDGLGNRIGGIIFGPKRVIIVVGVNKIVDNLEQAFSRIRRISIVNLKRHIGKHHLEEFSDLPCVKTGVCVDCRHPHRACNMTVIIEGQKPISKDHRQSLLDEAGQVGYESRMHVIVIGQELGI